MPDACMIAPASSLLADPRARQLLRNIASFRSAIRDLEASNSLRDCFDCLADAIDCFGWIGGTTGAVYARMMLDAFYRMDGLLAQVDLGSPETALSERLALWRLAKGMGLLRRHVLDRKADPMLALLHGTAASTTNPYLRLGLAWSLYGEKKGARELSLLFSALGGSELYHLETYYRKRNRHLISSAVSLPASEQRVLVERALGQIELLLPRFAELGRDLRSLRARLRDSLEELTTQATREQVSRSPLVHVTTAKNMKKAALQRPAASVRPNLARMASGAKSLGATSEAGVRKPAPPLENPHVQFWHDAFRKLYYFFPADDPTYFIRISSLGCLNQKVLRFRLPMTAVPMDLQPAPVPMRERLRAIVTWNGR